MNRWKQSTGAALLALMVTAAPAWAAADTAASGAVTVPAQQTVTGRLTYVDLEGGFYTVAGWALTGEQAQFQQYVGQQVAVDGTPLQGMTFQMTKALRVSNIRVTIPAQPASTAVLQAVQADRTLPTAVTVNGLAVTFDQQPMVSDGKLMVPLRFVVEAAGGTTRWDQTTQTVSVDLADRVATFTLGNQSAGLNRKGVFYIQQNFVKMSAAPTMVNGRMLVPADTLSSILGLQEQAGQAGALTLFSAQPASATPAKPADHNAGDTMKGTIKQIETGDHPRILVEGAAMANGEPSLTWLSINEQTKIAVKDAAGSLSDLAVGQTVSVSLAGPVLQSYPAQGAAASVTVQK
ncbi:MAG: hypothetical protein JWN15_3993 [Firmicutes bacterium]|nr:hypothetical protein [Bacillota bacterium]